MFQCFSIFWKRRISRPPQNLFRTFPICVYFSVGIYRAFLIFSLSNFLFPEKQLLSFLSIYLRKLIYEYHFTQKLIKMKTTIFIFKLLYVITSGLCFPKHAYKKGCRFSYDFVDFEVVTAVSSKNYYWNHNRHRMKCNRFEIK